MCYHDVPISDTGEATRKGFYKYEDKRKATPDPEIMTYIEKSRSMAGVTPDPEVWFDLFDVMLFSLCASLEKSAFFFLKSMCSNRMTWCCGWCMVHLFL